VREWYTRLTPERQTFFRTFFRIVEQSAFQGIFFVNRDRKNTGGPRSSKVVRDKMSQPNPQDRRRVHAVESALGLCWPGDIRIGEDVFARERSTSEDAMKTDDFSTISAAISTGTRMLLLCSLLTGCGISSPKYIDYRAKETPAPTQDPAAAACVATAVAAFSANLATPSNNDCANCHATIPKLKIVKSDDAGNRAELLKYTGTNPSKLFDYISSSAHRGGVRTSMTLAAITAWTTEEAKCVK